MTPERSVSPLIYGRVVPLCFHGFLRMLQAAGSHTMRECQSPPRSSFHTSASVAAP
jgi:hypothetical protein